MSIYKEVLKLIKEEKDLKEIKKILLEKGYSEEEINKAFKKLKMQLRKYKV